MKTTLLLFMLLSSNYLFGQEPGSKFSFEFGVSGNRYEYAEKGFGIENGLTYQVILDIKITPTILFAYGFYRYFHNQYEPSFVEARYLAFQIPISWRAPGKLKFISLGLGPSLTYRSRFENDTFKFYGSAGSTRIYSYSNGYMYNTLYAGMIAQIEAILYAKNRFSIKIFANSSFYFKPFKIDYYGLGIRTSIKI